MDFGQNSSCDQKKFLLNYFKVYIIIFLLYLDMGDGLVWTENQAGHQLVGVLKADDWDEPQNGPPFTFNIADAAPQKIKEWFDVERINNGSHMLKALTSFDREKQKYYFIPINVCDRKDVCAVSNLKLTIGE